MKFVTAFLKNSSIRKCESELTNLFMSANCEDEIELALWPLVKLKRNRTAVILIPRDSGFQLSITY